MFSHALAFCVLLLLAVARGQVLVGLNGVCSNSVQCAGVSVCVNQRCACPPTYTQMGASCVYMGYPGAPVPGGPYVPVAPAPSVPAPAPAPRVQPPPYLYPYGRYAPFPYYAYPGASCSARVRCLGGSSCIRGYCGCPTGYIVSGTTCVAQPAVSVAAPYYAAPPPAPAPLPPPVPAVAAPVYATPIRPAIPAVRPPVPAYNSCPAGQVFVGSSCVPSLYLSRYPNMLCGPGLECSGGAVCTNSICSCPNGYPMSNGYCSTPGVPLPASSVGVAAPVPAFVPSGGAPPVVPAVRTGVFPGPLSGSVSSVAGVALPPPAPVPAPAPLPYLSPSPLVGPGGYCVSTSQCIAGAMCNSGTCACVIPYTQYGAVCLRTRKSSPDQFTQTKEKEDG